MTEKKNFYIGNRVLLTSSTLRPALENPVVGTPWECAGTVVHVLVYGDNKTSNTVVFVNWDNERSNYYHPSHLSLADQDLPENNPNKLFKRGRHGQ